MKRLIRILAENHIPETELQRELRRMAQPSFDFYFLLVISAIIATFGLLVNSAATIIGAMIIAPLINPIITLSYALIRCDRSLLQAAFPTVISGSFLTVGIAILASVTIGSRVADTEILSRANPTLIDMAIAWACGMVGAFASTRRSIANALPGVAISVALVPPLCVVGIGLGLGKNISAQLGESLGETSLWAGALLLFLTNFVAIICSSSLVYIVQGYTAWQRAVLGLLIPILLLAILVQPLNFSFQEVLLRNRTNHAIQTVLAQYFPEFVTNSGSTNLSVSLSDDQETVLVLLDAVVPLQIFLNVESPESQQRVQEAAQLIESALELKLNRSVELKLRLYPYALLEATQDFENLEPQGAN